MHNLVKKVIVVTFASCALFLFINTTPAFCAMQAVELLCETGVNFYRNGRYDEALDEFNKALIIDPNNAVAKNYITVIFLRGMPIQSAAEAPSAKPITKKNVSPVHEIPPALSKYQQPKQGPNREEAINQALNDFGKKEEPKEEIASKKEIAGVKITGEIQLSLGVSPNDTIWKQANYDLNERNWRMLSDAAYNRRFNTYDPRIYDSLSLNLDTQNKEGFNFHSNITVDPWSFRGKGPKTTVTSAYGDTAEVELKYWSNTRYTINDTVYTKRLGNSFSLPEVKVKHDKTDPFVATGAFTSADTFNIPETKIKREFQPIRELWFDYNQETFNFRFFPTAFQDQALTSDDPLHITNHHVWWEDSTWLRRYRQGIYNSGADPVDFTKGVWDNSLAFLCRHSYGYYLTALRGFSFDWTPQEKTSFSATVATPQHLWQDYSEVDNAILASRFKHYLTGNLSLGATLTARTAFNVDDHNHIDGKNYVGGMDFGYEFIEGVKAYAEVLGSKTYYDLTDEDYRTKSRGNTYYFSIVSRYPRQSIMDLPYGYDDIKLGKNEVFLLKSKFYAAHMDDGFDTALSTYSNTRQDTFWSRHISFRKPFDYYYAGLNYPGLNWDEVNAIRIGDGIDIGRDVLGMRVEMICQDLYDNLFDVHNVHNVNGKYIENVARDELTVKINDKLTAKGLAIYHNLHKTYGGIDPFLYDSDTGIFAADYSSDPIDDGKNPTLKTGSLGLEYAFSDQLAVNGVWEHTNDYTLAYANFPRSVLNSTRLDGSYFEYNNKYRENKFYIYDQQLFPQPPYPFYNIYKCGVRVNPLEKMELYLGYTRNEFESAGQISDEMNHIGMEFAYMPTEKLGMALRYTYSRWKDLDRLRAGITKPVGHHNVFTEFRYFPSKDDEFLLQYGEGNTSAIGNITFDPFGGSLLTLDTQHIVRAYYRRKF